MYRRSRRNAPRCYAMLCDATLNYRAAQHVCVLRITKASMDTALISRHSNEEALSIDRLIPVPALCEALLCISNATAPPALGP